MSTHAHSDSHYLDIHEQTTFRLVMSLALTSAFVIFEAIAGYRAHSLALLSDAAHNFTDVIALALSWYAVRLSIQPANAQKTFGYHRAGILVALINSTSLVVMALGIFYEAYQRLLQPAEVDALTLIGVGSVAFLVNAGTAWLVMHGSEHDLNLRSTFLHLLGDVLSTVGAVCAGIVIYFTSLVWLDPLASVFIGVLILWNGWNILRETVDILLESTPRDIDMSEIVRDLMSVDGVRSVHDLHIWSITRSLRMLSAHVVTNDIAISDGVIIQKQINDMLCHEYNIYHTTLQLECQGCEPDLLYCDLHENGLSHHHHSH